MRLSELLDYNSSLLQTSLYKDYSPNGLQIEGKSEVQRIATAVTASQSVIDAALAWGADALLVHHGYFWRNEDAPIVGIKKRRIARLLASEVSLIAYHLPLDAHEILGNNAQLAGVLEIEPQRRVGEQNLLNLGMLSRAKDLAELTQWISERLHRVPQVVAGDGREIKTVAWCTGGAQGYFEQAILQGADAYLTGEISEQSFHLAQESGVAFIAAGHHATERYGIQALGVHLAERFQLQHKFFDQDNPV